MIPRIVSASLACLVLPAGVMAQAVRGVIADERDARPIVGAVVFLLDSADGVAARALTDESGAFRLRPARPGSYRLRALRIGFRPFTSDIVRVDADAELEHAFAMASVPVSLAALSVRARSTCRLTADTGAGAFAIWEQARTAFSAADLASRQDNMYVRLLMYERSVDASNRVRGAYAALQDGASTKPWVSSPPAVLRQNGYVSQSNGMLQYIAPDLDVLLSTEFVEDHCFRVVRGRDDSQVGLAFEPAKQRSRIPEIRGTIWLDRESAELRRVEFQYINLPGDVTMPSGVSAPGGVMDFVRMASGGWWIARWNIDMPILVRDEQLMPSGPIERAQLGVPLRLVETRTRGGELVLVSRYSDTLFAHEPLTLTGTIIEAPSDVPVADARVSIPSVRSVGRSDIRGRFVLAGLIPGDYDVRVQRATADSLEEPWSSTLTFTGRDDTVRLRIPPPQRVAQAATPIVGSLAGRVLSHPDGNPIFGAEVRLVDLDVITRTDSAGRFNLGRVPPGTHVVAARQVGYAAVRSTLTFTDTSVIRHVFRLERVQVLDTVSVAERRTSVPEFDERRKLGIGHFIARPDLAKAEHRRLGDVLSTVPGLRVFRAPGGQAWVMNGRRSAGSTTLDSFSKAQGARQGCYSDVFLDGLPVYIGSRPGMLFDVNTIVPSTLEGVEYYASAGQAPVKFNRYDNQCGVLVLWSRIGP